MFDVLVDIYRVNKATYKVTTLEQILDNVEYVRLSLRLLRDLRVLNLVGNNSLTLGSGLLIEKKYVRLLVLCEDVKGQFERWCGYEKKNL